MNVLISIYKSQITIIDFIIEIIMRDIIRLEIVFAISILLLYIQRKYLIQLVQYLNKTLVQIMSF